MFQNNKPVKWILRIHFIFVLFIIFIPLITLIAFSFNQAAYPGFPWSGFTIEWYAKLFHDQKMIAAIVNSIIVGFSTSLLSTFIGVIGALAFYRSRYIFSKIGLSIVYLPPLVPSILSGIAFVTFLRYVPIPKSLLSIIIFQSVIFFPVALGIISIRLKEIDPRLRDASMNLGGGYHHYFLFVLFPLLKNTLIGVTLLLFALSWDEFVISWFVSSFQETIPIRVWLLMKSSITPTINALGTLSFMVSFILLFFAQKFIFGKKREG